MLKFKRSYICCYIIYMTVPTFKYKKGQLNAEFQMNYCNIIVIVIIVIIIINLFNVDSNKNIQLVYIVKIAFEQTKSNAN